jgi:hypothetical protein
VAASVDNDKSAGYQEGQRDSFFSYKQDSKRGKSQRVDTLPNKVKSKDQSTSRQVIFNSDLKNSSLSNRSSLKRQNSLCLTGSPSPDKANNAVNNNSRHLVSQLRNKKKIEKRQIQSVEKSPAQQMQKFRKNNFHRRLPTMDITSH